jgi:hypothetical protein
MKERRSFHSTIFLASCGVFALMISMAQLGWAQAEIDPDHYEGSDQPVSTAQNTATASHNASSFRGEFTLPFDVAYRGQILRPGSYSVSVRPVGKANIVTLIPNGKTAKVRRIQAQASAQPGTAGANALVLECKGQERRLAAIRLNQARFTFDSRARQSRSAAVHTELIPIS